MENYFIADDGHRLFYRDYASPGSLTPVICVPGLQTDSRSFQFIAPRIAETRRVLCIDPRGRGRSDYDPDPENYRLRRESRDIRQLASHAGVLRSVILGTSRGGLSGLIAAAYSELAAGLILVDIGPQIELAAMDRLVRDIAPSVSFGTWAEAANSLKHAHGRWFPNLSDEKWRFWAETIYKEKNGRIVPASDHRLGARVLDASEGAQAAAGHMALWPVFQRLPPMPVLVIRGELSDVLSEETVARMQFLRPDIVVATVKDRGHRPFLDEPESVAALRAFFQRAQ